MNNTTQKMVIGAGTVTFTNGEVSLTKNLVFGLCVLTEDGWYPFADLDGVDKGFVINSIDRNPTCPFLDLLTF